ncbi:MAG TPA: ABC transporter ATP-binding protein [Patescibacteria group bacterium]|jgi:ABC-2 type transport system ATP-binding protein|nr:ABC transporter ATP-binding protein [Patescibacteria group bacterium]
MDAISANNLSVKKSRKEVLNKLDLRVKRGTVTGLIGPSGSGKTTLIRAVVGAQTLQGELNIFGLPAGSPALRSDVGYVTQSPAVYGDISVIENLQYFAALMNVGSSAIDTVIHQVDLDSQRNQLVSDLSGGQRARVSLAVALLGEPKLLVLDEPTVGLDPILRNHIWSMFHDLAEAGTTLLVSSHVMDEADRCDELILLRDGDVLWNDTRAALLTKTGQSSVGDAFVSIIESKGASA